MNDLIKSIEDYIKFYNEKRFQKRLKCLTPLEYRSEALTA